MPQTVSPVPEADLRKIICEPVSGDLLVKTAERLGEQLSRTLRAAQIRAIFDEAHSIGSLFLLGKSEEAVHRAYLLDPKMAYRAKRAGAGAETLAAVLKNALKVVLEAKEDPEEVKSRYSRFLEFFEAIVAYHKAHGGKD
ncbi:type III-A CRISPR-associated protein Csm2 [Candidatus Bipolaricaulota bacterium]|nr:type III-A CRISPR-associated protein Csm2 [Candidatus Bipolaricaulota bacterium]